MRYDLQTPTIPVEVIWPRQYSVNRFVHNRTSTTTASRLYCADCLPPSRHPVPRAVRRLPTFDRNLHAFAAAFGGGELCDRS